MLALERRNLILEKLQAETRVVVSELSPQESECSWEAENGGNSCFSFA